MWIIPETIVTATHCLRRSEIDKNPYRKPKEFWSEPETLLRNVVGERLNSVDMVEGVITRIIVKLIIVNKK
jgi:hypothetical protein